MLEQRKVVAAVGYRKFRSFLHIFEISWGEKRVAYEVTLLTVRHKAHWKVYFYFMLNTVSMKASCMMPRISSMDRCLCMNATTEADLR